ncbi:hypothetical protein ACH44C_32930 [Streptomyces purpureus]|uniref:hypothetical protein n=1 Tax=Streptomyces purpureus TaxID=1951 RepID=UPI0037A9776A
MSRETDSSSSGAKGRGGAAYPSGTPPYGSRQYPSLHPAQDAPGDAADGAGRTSPPVPEEKKTETTLTTRIRINIPGSRPIPPVVMRTPMSDASETERAAEGADESASDTAGISPWPDGSQKAVPTVVQAEEPAPAEEKTSDWFAPRKPAAPAASSAPAAPSGPAAPPAPAAGGPGPGQGPRPGGTQGQSGLPYFSEGAPGAARSGGPTPPPGMRPPGGPTGPTGGPVTGSSPLTGGPMVPGPMTPNPLAPNSMAPSPMAPGPMSSGLMGGGPMGGAPRMADDTAVLTPQQTPPSGHVSGDTLTSGIPVVPADHRSPAGSPFPSSGPGDSFSTPDFPGPAGPGGAPLGARTNPSAASPAPAPAAKKPTPQAPVKKRSKVALAGFGVLGLLGVAYGAGLLLNHSDVPKGTTVLGVDIGGGTREEAVNKLDAALGKRATAPLEISVAGKKQQLTPDKAGLTLDSQATVRGAAGSDYNPMSVIGSLFGGERVAHPVIPVDNEKLRVALTDMAGASGSATEGTIKFVPGKAVAVPGQAGRGVDVPRSMISVKDAYRAQVETGRTNTVELPVVTREPTITKAELDRAMKEFAEPAMSGLITIKAGGKEIKFGPAKSLPKILSMKPINGKLVEVYDKKAIDELLDGVFDGIMITKGDGKKHQLSVDDVAQAMQEALLGKTPAERTKVIELDPKG